MKKLLFVLTAMALPALAWAQVDRATLTGVVRDPSNAAIAGATVSVTHISTGVGTRAVTTDEGTYLVVNLPPGEVIVEAEAAGFQRFARTVVLAVGSRASLDLTLSVGALSETVKVE